MNDNPFEGLSQETIDIIAKAAATSGFTYATGVVGFDLAPLASLVPVNTPVYQRIPRKSGMGSINATWHVLLNINNSQPNPFVGPDAGGYRIQVQQVQVAAPYVPVRVSGSCTRDSQDYSRGYANTKTLASSQTLSQWRLAANKALIGGQAYALPTIGTVALSTATTGGSIAASTTVHVRCAARSPLNFFWGGSGIASTDQSIATGSGTATNTVTATVPAVVGAVAYDWYVAGFYVTTTTANTYTATSVPGANAANPPSLPSLYKVAPVAVPTADASYSSKSYNGVVAATLGDYTDNGPIATPGTGQYSSGATWISLNGSTLTNDGQGILEWDNMLLSIYNAAELSPTVMIMNAQQAQDAAKKILANNSAMLYLEPGVDRTDMTAGGMVGHYINKADGGSIVDILVDPHWPIGTIGFFTEELPYPDNDESATFEARYLRDVAEFPYGPQLIEGDSTGGPREVWDQSSIETLVHRGPVACGIMACVGAG